MLGTPETAGEVAASDATVDDDDDDDDDDDEVEFSESLVVFGLCESWKLQGRQTRSIVQLKIKAILRLKPSSSPHLSGHILFNLQSYML